MIWDNFVVHDANNTLVDRAMKVVPNCGQHNGYVDSHEKSFTTFKDHLDNVGNS